MLTPGSEKAPASGGARLNLSLGVPLVKAGDADADAEASAAAEAVDAEMARECECACDGGADGTLPNAKADEVEGGAETEDGADDMEDGAMAPAPIEGGAGAKLPLGTRSVVEKDEDEADKEEDAADEDKADDECGVGSGMGAGVERENTDCANISRRRCRLKSV
jgi:hypothetical protein